MDRNKIQNRLAPLTAVEGAFFWGIFGGMRDGTLDGTRMTLIMQISTDKTDLISVYSLDQRHQRSMTYQTETKFPLM